MNYADLYKRYPCREGREWLAQQEREGRTLAEAWETCPRGDWLLWGLDATGNLSDALNLRLQLLALDTPLGDGTDRTVLDLITDPRSLAFVEIKRRRLAGENISGDDWALALGTAWDAARGGKRILAETAAWDTAEETNDGAAEVVVVITKGSGGTKAAARIAARLWQANAIREIVPNPFQEGVNDELR